MAELAGSIIGIVSAGTKVTLVLSQLASDKGSAGKEAKMIASEIRSFITVLRTLGETMDKVQTSQYYSHCTELVEDMTTASLEMFTEILDAAESLNDPSSGNDGRDGKFGLVGRLQWVVFKKPKILVLRAAIGAYKSTLALMLGTLNTAEKAERRKSSVDTNDDTVEQEQDRLLLQSLEMNRRASLIQLEHSEMLYENLEDHIPVDQLDLVDIEAFSTKYPRIGSWVSSLMGAARDEISSIRSSISDDSIFDLSVLQGQVAQHSQQLSILLEEDQDLLTQPGLDVPSLSSFGYVASVPDEPWTFSTDIEDEFSGLDSGRSQSNVTVWLPGLSDQQNTFYKAFRDWLIQQPIEKQLIMTQSLTLDIKTTQKERSTSKPPKVSPRSNDMPLQSKGRNNVTPQNFESHIIGSATRQVERYNSWKANNELFIYGLPTGLSLNLGNSSIEELPEQVIRLSCGYLDQLFLHCNLLTNLPENMFFCVHLHYLNLSYNKFEVIPPPVLQLESLKSLNMSWNKLTHIPANISSLTKLEALRLSNNRIQGIPLGISEMESLEILDCRENPVWFPSPSVLDLSVPSKERRSPSFPKGEDSLAELTRLLKQYLGNQDARMLSNFAVHAIAGELPLETESYSQPSSLLEQAPPSSLPAMPSIKIDSAPSMPVLPPSFNARKPRSSIRNQRARQPLPSSPLRSVIFANSDGLHRRASTSALPSMSQTNETSISKDELATSDSEHGRLKSHVRTGDTWRQTYQWVFKKRE